MTTQLPAKRNLLQLRSGLAKDRIRFRASRYEYAKGDERPEIIGAVSRQQGFFTRQDFLEICEWKTPRSRRQCLRNSEDDIISQTRIALKITTPERDRVRALRDLRGVEWATASVILHFAHADRYPILDYRALWSLGVEESRQYIPFDFWWDYVQTCRTIAEECKLSMRELDRALWQFSKENQSPQP